MTCEVGRPAHNEGRVTCEVGRPAHSEICAQRAELPGARSETCAQQHAAVVTVTTATVAGDRKIFINQQSLRYLCDLSLDDLVRCAQRDAENGDVV